MKLLILEGDGIGPEIVGAARGLLEATARRHDLALTLETALIGHAAFAADGHTCPESVLDQSRAADGVILGPVDHFSYPPASEGGVNPSAALRTGLDLYANLRPARTREGVPALGKPMDLLIARENTEGFYADRNMAGGASGEFTPIDGVALAMRKITAKGSRRIAEAAFREAARRRKSVTAVHKANVMKVTDGLFLQETRAVAAAHPDIAYDEVIVDAAAAWLVRAPERFDVIVTTNMFGDILSDEASELAGGLGLAPSINAGADHVMAQAQHGSAPDIAGQGVANPTSIMLSIAMMLDWLGDRRGAPQLGEAAATMSRAVEQALTEAEHRTPDLGGAGTTAGFGVRTAELARRV